MADVKIKGRYMIKPAEPTWEGVITLTELDQVAGAPYVPTIYFYKPSDALKSTNVVGVVREALSRALVYYYPIGGRVHKVKGGKRLEIRCESDTMGVELIEAESSSQLEDFGDYTCTEKFQHLLPFVDQSKPLHELPQYVAQLTHLRCGGLSFGLMISHAVGDGMASLSFTTDMARIARGESLDVLPCHDRTILRAGEPPKEDPSFEQTMAKLSALVNQHSISEEPPKEADTVMLPLTKDQVEKLKQAANDNIDKSERPYSRFEVLAAHIWRCTCKARGNNSEDLKALGIVVDARSRVRALPPKYFGNASFVTAARSNVGELLTMPLGYACATIRKAISNVTEDYIWSEIEFLKNLDDFSICQQLRAFRVTEEPYVNPNPGVISWLSLPVYSLNLGWGTEAHMSPGIHKVDGLSLILPAREGVGSLLVIVSLQVDHIHKFKKHFYEEIV